MGQITLGTEASARTLDHAFARTTLPMVDPRGGRGCRFMVHSLSLFAAFVATTSAAQAEDLNRVLASAPVRSWKTSNAPTLKFCVITSIAGKTGQASTVVDSGADTVVIVHNWSSPVPGNDVRAIITIKPDGELVFRGQKTELIREMDRCTNL